MRGSSFIIFKSTIVPLILTSPLSKVYVGDAVLIPTLAIPALFVPALNTLRSAPTDIEPPIPRYSSDTSKVRPEDVWKSPAS